MTSSEPSNPSPFAYILSFLIVGLCWGFTTPFIRRAALTYTTPTHPSITDPRRSWLTRQLAKAFFTIVGLLKSPGYAVPLLCNLTGSVWFFLLVGKAGESLFQCCELLYFHSCRPHSTMLNYLHQSLHVFCLSPRSGTFRYTELFGDAGQNHASKSIAIADLLGYKEVVLWHAPSRLYGPFVQLNSSNSICISLIDHLAYFCASLPRTLSYRADHKFTCLPLHSPGRLVRGRQDHQQGYMVGHGIGLRGYWHVCRLEDMTWTMYPSAPDIDV
jgi:Putative transmembrane family 234